MIASFLDPQLAVRQQHLAERVHDLGAPAMLHLLREVATGADLNERLERYAALPADFIRQLGGTSFSRPLHIVSGGAP